MYSNSGTYLGAKIAAVGDFGKMTATAGKYVAKG